MVEIAVKRLPVIVVLSAMVAGTWLLWLTSKPAPVVPIAMVKPGVPPPAAKGSLRYSKSGPKRKSGVGNSAETPADDAGDATGSVSPVPPKPVMAGQKEFVLPSRLKAIVDLHNQMPRPEQILNLSSADAAILADVYRQTTNLADRSSLTWALGVAGNEETVELLKNTLTNEFKGRQLTSGKGEPDNEELVMFDTLKAMGLLAARYDSARDFVLQGTDPAYWATNANWTTSGGNNTVGLLTIYSIMAVGQSGREDVPDLLAQIAERDLIHLTPKNVAGGLTFEGSMMQAAYFNYYIQKYGLDDFQKDFITMQQGKYWNEWSVTDDGKRSQSWAAQVAAKRQQGP